MRLFDFCRKKDKGEYKAVRSGTKSSPKKTYTCNTATKDNWHDAVGISESDEFDATVYERRGYGIMVRFMHKGKEYYGLVHNKNIAYVKIYDSTDLFRDGEEVRVVVLGFDEKERIMLGLKYPKWASEIPAIPQIEENAECCCIVREIKDKYVVVDIEGCEGVTGYIRISEMSQAFVECPSYMFEKGERISAIAISQVEKGKVQLSFKKAQDTSIYQVGKDIEVRKVLYKPDTQKVIVVTQDKNKMLASVPYKEISWTNDTSIQQECFSVRIKNIDTNDNRYKLTCSIRELKENPWEKAVYTKGMGIQVIVDSYTEKGINIITDDKYNLPGIIRKDQVTWLKDEDKVTEEDYPKLNSKINVSILNFVSENQFLSCSIREQQDNPWLHIQIGDTVKGIVCTKSDLHIVCLESGIECECCDKRKFNPNEEYEFIVTDIDIQQKRIEVSSELLQRANYYSKKVSDFFRRRSVQLNIVKWKSNDKRTTYVLLPQNILFNGESIAAPYMNKCISFLENTPPTHFKEIGRSDKKTDIVFVSVDMSDMGLTMPTIDITKMQHRELHAKIVFETKNCFIVNTVGILGYFEKNGNAGIGHEEEVTVMLANEQYSPMQFYKFDLVSDIRGNTETNSKEEFLTEDEKKVIDEKDLALIKSLQEDIPGITRKNCHVFNEEVCLVYSSNFESEVNRFFEKEGKDLLQQNFWLSMRTEKNTGKQTVAIFNCNDSILLCDASNKSFFIKEVHCSKERERAQYVLNQFSHGHNLVLSGARLRICKYLSTNNFDFERLNRILSRQYAVVAEILPELSDKVKDRKKEIGQEYLVVSNFLKFQKNKEEKRLQDLELSVGQESAHLGTFEDNVCIVLENADCSRFFAENEDRQAVKLVPAGTENAISGILTKDDENYVVYFKSEKELSAYCRDGFVLTPVANVYHLKIQDRSVKEFVFNNPLLDKLNDGKLCPPEINGSIEFFNPVFNHVEEGNNQPVAIRKAVGNQDIFLIQGPPGTGKTSVVVEIIRQLVKKGEHVLVCSQAHSAVENIYDRLLNEDNSIRVGFLDDEKTMRAMSSEDYQKFLKRNMLMLDNLQKGGDDKLEVISSYNDYSDYLQESYQNKHRQLLEYALTLTRSCSSMIDIADDFLKEIKKSNNDGDNRFYMASHIHSLQVVMGTCIGIGTNATIKNSGMKFDTLIIDEAGKANMAETNVPMSLAKKYILVGDHNQLPPYMDIQEIKGFKDSDEAEEKNEAKIKSALGKSLFEDFLNDLSFPEESKVLLNYQYRMNPDIGKMISDLFYAGKLNNGTGTERQTCELEDFQAPITFCDTGDTKSTLHYNPYERNSGNGNIYNPCEIDVICNEIVPKIENLLIKDSSLSVGIVAPYSEQVRRLKKELRGSSCHLENCVYTIDNIQGQEYDIVILSFVRSFRGKKTVGFLDDLRRLNVALSRAKKKLIMVGNLKTLCRPEAHRENGLGGTSPEEVFASLKKVIRRHAELNNIDKLRRAGKHPGDIFRNCPITISRNSNQQIIKCKFSITLEGESRDLEFSFPAKPYGDWLLQEGEHFDFKWICENSKDSDRPLFEIVPLNMEAEIMENKENTGMIKLPDGHTLKVRFDNRDWILKQILTGDTGGLVFPFAIKGHFVSLDTEMLQQCVNSLSGNKFVVQIVSKTEKGYWVWCAKEKVVGFVVKNPNQQPSLKPGDVLECRIYKRKEESVTFNYLRKIQ